VNRISHPAQGIRKSKLKEVCESISMLMQRQQVCKIAGKIGFNYSNPI